MTDGFEADVDALKNAKRSLAWLIDDMREHPVNNFDAMAAIGDEDLAAATDEFCSRWDQGVKHLLKDAATTYHGIEQAIPAFEEFEHDAAERISGVQDHGNLQE